MKKCLTVLLCLCLLASIVGCTAPTSPATEPPTQPSDPTPSTAPTQPSEPAPAVHQSPLVAIALPLHKEAELSDDGSKELFVYTYQDVYLTLPDAQVAETVTLELMNRIDATRPAAQNVLADAKANADLHPYSYDVTYKPKRIDKGVLSLCGSQMTISGAPHPNTVNVSVTYDLSSGNVLSFRDILTQEYSAPQLNACILEALEPQSDHLYGYYEDIVRERFEGDLNSVENWYLSDSGLCIYFSPYDIAPYASGTILAEIPYEKLGGILKDAYFPPERTEAGGSIQVQPFSASDTSRYTQIAELKLGSEGETRLLSTDGLVYDVRIELAYGAASDYYPIATLFAMEQMTAADAITVQGDTNQPNTVLLVRYVRNGETVSDVIAAAVE